MPQQWRTGQVGLPLDVYAGYLGFPYDGTALTLNDVLPGAIFVALGGSLFVDSGWGHPVRCPLGDAGRGDAERRIPLSVQHHCCSIC